MTHFLPFTLKSKNKLIQWSIPTTPKTTGPMLSLTGWTFKKIAQMIWRLARNMATASA